MMTNTNNVEIKEFPKGPMDATPTITVIVEGRAFSEVRRERGWLVAELPDDEEGMRVVRGRTLRDLRIRAGALN